MPGAKVNLTLLRHAGGSPAYPDAVAPSGAGGQGHGELTAINKHQFLFLERDGAGDGTAAPRFKKLFLLDTHPARADGDHTSKTLLADLRRSRTRTRSAATATTSASRSPRS